MGCTCGGIEHLETGTYSVLKSKLANKMNSKIRQKLVSTDPFYYKVADELGVNVTDDTLDG